MNIELIEIPLSAFIEEGWHLAIEHYEEVAKATGAPLPSIDVEQLISLENCGMIFTIGAFDGEKLIGYSVNQIGRSFNFHDVIMVDNQGLFVSKQYRNTRAGLRLIDETNRVAKERGAVRATWHTYLGTRAATLFDRLGYKAHDIIYTKEL